MTSTLFILQIVLAILITILVLLQKSSSIGLGAYSGSNESLFGAKGPAGFLTKATFILGLLFVINTLVLGYMYSKENKKSAVDTIENVVPAPKTAPKPFAPSAPTAPTTKSEANSSNTTKIDPNRQNSSLEANNTNSTSKQQNSAIQDSNLTVNQTASNTTNEANSSSNVNGSAKNPNISQKDEIEAKIKEVLKNKSIKFATDSSFLEGDSINTIKEIANILKKYPNVVIEIGGHTDNVGNEDANKKLSQERVNSVKKALVEFGVNEANLKAVGYGSSKPLVDNSTAENRAKNRRVEFRVIQK